MKKFLIIGDIHGRDDWTEIANDALTKFQHIIFVGDYVDSFDIRPVLIKHNLEAIIGFKIQNPDNVTLLLGNHDWAYIYDESCSGFKWQMWQDYKKIFKDNIDLFDVAYGYENWKTKKYTLVTHAGLTKNWYNYNILPMLNDKESKLYKLTEGKDVPLHEMLNYLKGDKVMWKVGAVRGGGSHPSPLWADYLELIENAYPDINQIFGHTASGTASTFQNGDDLIIKVDGHYNYKLSHMTVSL
jgi:hypothetical protein